MIVGACPADNNDLNGAKALLATHAEAVRQYDSNSYRFHRSELAEALGEHGHRLDEALEFMREEGWAGTSGDSDTWWVL